MAESPLTGGCFSIAAKPKYMTLEASLRLSL
jgi:hypothetical protein